MKTQCIPFILFSTLIVLLSVACQPVADTAPVTERQDVSIPAAAAVPDELPNILVLTDAVVEVRRQDGDFLPATLGTELAPGDLVLLHSGEAAIFCGAETQWESSPLPLTIGQQTGVSCGEGRPPRPYPHWSTILGISRGISDTATLSTTLTVLSPRKGWVIDARPDLVWQEIAGATSYTVTLGSDDGQARSPIVAAGSPLPYPDTWAPLEGLGAAYWVMITADNGAHNDLETTPGFSLLEDPAPLKAKIERLRQRPLTEPALTLLLAELYLTEKLRSEAVALLTALPNADQLAAVQNLLGEIYLTMELVDQSEATYTQLLTLAQDGGLLEAEAQAHVGLGYVACARSNQEQVEAHWTQAHTLFEQIPLPVRVDQVTTLLTQIDQECS